MTTKPPTEPPLSVWLSPSMRAVDDDDSNPYSWPSMSGASLAFMSKRDNSETYVHLDQFSELLTQKVKDISIEREGLHPEECCEVALAEIVKDITEGKI